MLDRLLQFFGKAECGECGKPINRHFSWVFGRDFNCKLEYVERIKVGDCICPSCFAKTMEKIHIKIKEQEQS